MALVGSFYFVLQENSLKNNNLRKLKQWILTRMTAEKLLKNS